MVSPSPELGVKSCLHSSHPITVEWTFPSPEVLDGAIAPVKSRSHEIFRRIRRVGRYKSHIIDFEIFVRRDVDVEMKMAVKLHIAIHDDSESVLRG